MISIALDGPAGAGKSSIAKALAEKLGFIYVDTGALYRAIGLKFLNFGCNTDLNCDIGKILKCTSVEIRHVNGEQHVFLDREDVNGKIRTAEVAMMASAVSAVPEVRAFLLETQRKFAEKYNVIMDGRDIGTVVLPNADIKIFLTASVKVRAERRFRELTEKGESVNFEEVYADIEKRDYNDTHRAVAPLKQAEGACLADTSDLTLDESVALVIKIITEGTKKA